MRRHKLRFHWYMMTAFCILIICLISLIWFSWVKQYSSDRSQEMFEISVAKSEQNLSNYFRDFQKVAKIVSYSSTVQTYLFESGVYDRLNTKSAIKDLFNQMLDSYSTIKDIVFLLPDNSPLTSSGRFSAQIKRLLKQEGGTLEVTTKEPYFLYTDEQFNIVNPLSVESAYFIYALPVYATVPGEFHAENAALCVLVGNLKDLASKELSDPSTKQLSMKLLAFEQVIFADGAFEENADLAASVPLGWNNVKKDGTHLLTYRGNINSTDWEGVFLAEATGLETDFLPMRKFLFLLLVIFFIAMILLMLLGMRSISFPIHQLMDQIRRLRFDSQKNSEKLPQLSGVEEIEDIRCCINDMIDRMEQEKKKGYKMQEELFHATIAVKQSMLQYYRSQINPHFLYNSLECIRSIAQLRHVDEICRMSIALASLFRYAINEDTEVLLETELHNVQDYFNVIAIRKPDQYYLRINVAENIRNKIVQRMILQPLVENAIQHGSEEKRTPFIISISATVLPDGFLHIAVVDNGIGITEAHLKELQEVLFINALDADNNQQIGIGLVNISNRLKLAYGGLGSLKIYSKYGYYTKVELIVPVSQADSDDLNALNETEK